MNKETHISDYFSDTNDRKATIAADKYHYIVRLYEISKNGNLNLWATRLIRDKHLKFAEDLAENFVTRIGEFKELEWPTRLSNQA